MVLDCWTGGTSQPGPHCHVRNGCMPYGSWNPFCEPRMVSVSSEENLRSRLH